MLNFQLIFIVGLDINEFFCSKQYPYLNNNFPINYLRTILFYLISAHCKKTKFNKTKTWSKLYHVTRMTTFFICLSICRVSWWTWPIMFPCTANVCKLISKQWEENIKIQITYTLTFMNSICTSRDCSSLRRPDATNYVTLN